MKRIASFWGILCAAFIFPAQASNDAPGDVAGAVLWLDASDPNANGSTTGDAFNGISNTNPWKDKTSNAFRTVPVTSVKPDRNTINIVSSTGKTTPFITGAMSGIGGKPAFNFTASNEVAYQLKAAGPDGIFGNSDDVGLDLRPIAASGAENITIFTVYRSVRNPVIAGDVYGSALWGLDDSEWDRMFFNSWGFFSGGVGNNGLDGLVGTGNVGGGRFNPPNNSYVPIKTSNFLGDDGLGANRLLTVSYQHGQTNGSFVSFNGTENGATFTRFTDATSTSTDNDGNNSDGQQPVFSIGWDGNDNYAEAYIAEVIVYKRSLNACDAHKVNFFLSEKYSNDFWGPIPDDEPCLVDLMNKARAYADLGGTPDTNLDGDNDPATPATLTRQDYINVSAGNVFDGNLAIVNAAVLAKAASDITTVASLQTIIDQAVIENYADTNGSSLPVPTPAIYQSAGVTGVNANNIASINSRIAAKNKADVDSAAKIQSIVALDELSEDLNGNSNSTKLSLPLLKAIIGVTGIVDANIDAYNNAFVSSAFTNDNAPTVAEINTVIDSVNSVKAINELSEDIKGNVNGTKLTLAQLKDITGVTGVVDANIDAYNNAFLSSAFADDDAPTPTEINAVISTVNTLIANALTKIQNYADDSSIAANKPTITDFTDLGVTGVTSSNLDGVNAFIEQKTAVDLPDQASVQRLVDRVNRLATTISVADATIKEGETKNLAVTISQPAGADGQEIVYTLTGKSAGANAADVTSVSGQVVLAAGTTQGVIPITAVADGIDEAAIESMALGLSIDSVINSGFENGSAGFVPLSAGKTFEINPETTYGGSDPANNVLEVDQESQGYQDLLIKPGVPYRLSFKASRRINSAPTGSVNVTVRLFDISSGQELLNNTESLSNTVWKWQDFSYTSTASHNSRYVRLEFTTDNTQTLGVLIDNLSLVAVSRITDDASSTIQIIDSDAANALQKVQDYADDQASPVLTSSDFSVLDITGVTAGNLSDVNRAIAAKTSAEVDTVSKVQAIVDDVIATTNNNNAIAELIEDLSGNGNGNQISLAQLKDIIGVTGIIDTNLEAYRSAFVPDAFTDAANPAIAEINAVIKTVNESDVDTDKDGISNKKEIELNLDPLNDDSDADGIKDGVEIGDINTPRDTDGDGAIDARDADDDGDTVLTATELNDGDADGDNIPDYLDVDSNTTNGTGGDSDKDGLTDRQECPAAPNCADSDKDGIPDYMDTDSDNNNIKDADETGALTDTDGDGIADFADTDDDNDGKSDLDELNGADKPENATDSDLDKIPDHKDADSMNDAGTADNSGDSDKDGLSDTTERGEGEQPRDTDSDRIPDYMDIDSDNDGISDAGVCLVSTGCGAKDPQGGVETGIRGAGSLNLLFILVLAALVLGRRYRLLLLALPLAANAADVEKSGVYVGAGIGNSWLEPKTSGDFRVKDKTDTAYKLTAGWDWNDFLSFEGYYARLGESRLSPQGKIDYRMLGADVIGHYWLYGVAREEGSLALYGKGGFNHMTNDGRGLSYKKQKTAQLMFGLGAEYYLPKALSVRLEWESYDKDASLLSLNLIKRFGRQPVYQPAPAIVEPVVVEPVVVEPEPQPEPQKTALIEPVIEENEADLLVAAVAVEEVIAEAEAPESIADVDVLVVSIGFALNSDEISQSGKATLDKLVADFTQFPQAQLEVQAHTDSQGSKAYNQLLSQRRAESVQAYLIEQGVQAEQLTAVGYGESQPRESNDTAEGRAKNRRVEFKVLQR